MVKLLKALLCACNLHRWGEQVRCPGCDGWGPWIRRCHWCPHYEIIGRLPDRLTTFG